MARGKKTQQQEISANPGFGNTLGAAADKLPAHTEAAENQYLVLELNFLPCISDSFEAHRGQLIAGKSQGEGVLIQDHAPAFRKVKLGDLIDLMGSLGPRDRSGAGSVFPLLPSGGHS